MRIPACQRKQLKKYLQYTEKIIFNVDIINLTKYEGKLKTLSGMNELENVKPIFSEETQVCTSEKETEKINKEWELKSHHEWT